VYQVVDLFFCRLFFFWLFLLSLHHVLDEIDIPELDHDTRFALWQVKMRAILTQAEVDDGLDKFGVKDSKSWTDEEKRKDHKALTQIQLHLQIIFCKIVCRRILQLLYGSS